MVSKALVEEPEEKVGGWGSCVGQEVEDEEEASLPPGSPAPPLPEGPPLELHLPSQFLSFVLPTCFSLQVRASVQASPCSAPRGPAWPLQRSLPVQSTGVGCAVFCPPWGELPAWKERSLGNAPSVHLQGQSRGEKPSGQTPGQGLGHLAPPGRCLVQLEYQDAL